MLTFHSNCFRLKDTGSGSSNAAELSKLLLPNVKHLKPIEEAFQAILSKVTNLVSLY